MTAPTTIAVLDFEATCADAKADPTWRLDEQEVIEFPVSLVRIADGAHVDTFHRMVRPTRQPRLTAFCTELTSIEQHEVDAAPTIEEVIPAFEAWLAEHDLSAATCLVATCGDWDLRRMWPQQASLHAALPTPPVFRSWCNLKVPFAARAGRKAGGMLDMLGFAGIEHVGRHHRGLDDVRNLVALVQWMLAEGVELRATWGEAERREEVTLRERKLEKRRRARDVRRQELERLPERVQGPVRERIAGALEALDEELTRRERYLRALR